MTETDNFEAGIATLSADPNENFDSNNPWKVSGVAVPENTILKGGRKVEHFYPPETLEGAGELLEGSHIVKNFHEIDGQATADDIIGEVTNAGYQKGIGLVFDGEITDQEIAEKVAHGYLDVSPSPVRSLGEFDESMGGQAVNRLVDFRDLAVVGNGQPGAKIEMGSNPAVEALSLDALSRGFDALEASDMTPPEQAQTNAQAVLDVRDKTDAMTDTGWNRAEQLASGEDLSESVIEKMAQFNRHRDNTEYDNYADIPESKKSEDAENPWWEDNGTVAWLGWGGTAGVDWARNRSEDLDTNAQDVLKEVAGVEFDGTATGKLDESEIPNDDFESHYLYPGDTKSESSYPVVDGDGNLRKGNVDSAWQLGARGGVDDEDHDRRLLNLAEEFDDPPEWATEQDTNKSPARSDFVACGIDVPEDMQNDDGAHENSPQSSAAAADTDTMSDENLTDEQKAILRAAEDVEGATDVLNAYADADDPEIVETDVLNAKDEQLDEFAGVFRDALRDTRDLKESTVEAMPVDALAEEFRDEDGELDVDTLAQNPETEAGGGSDPDDGGIDTLSAEEKEQVKDNLRRADMLEGRTPKRVDALRSEAAELAGVDDADEIEVDAL